MFSQLNSAGKLPANSSMALNSRQLLLPVSDDEKQYSSGQFYVNKKDFDKSMADAMTLSPPPQAARPSASTSASSSAVSFFPLIMIQSTAVESVFYTDEKVLEIVSDEAAAYFAGDKGLDECAAQIQSRVKLYVNEQR